MRLTRRCKMPGTPASYRVKMEEEMYLVPSSPWIKDVVEKLGRYEDTGMEPEEIEEMLNKKRNRNTKLKST